MKRNDWELGRDLAIVVSSDAVHYGPDFDHAPFGTDAEPPIFEVLVDGVSLGQVSIENPKPTPGFDVAPA